MEVNILLPFTLQIQIGITCIYAFGFPSVVISLVFLLTKSHGGF